MTPRSGKLARAISRFLMGEYKPPESRRLLAQRIVGGNFDRSLARNIIHREERGPKQDLTGSSPFYCARRAGYSLGIGDVKPDSVSVRSLFSFTLGDASEDVVVAALICSEAGEHLISPTETGQKVVTRVLEGGDQIVGHLDLSLDGAFWGEEYAGREVVVDVKSASSFGYDKMVREGVTNDFGYIDQLMGVYAAALDAPFGAFLLVNKDMGFFSDLIVPRSPEAENRVEASYKMVQASKAKDQLPPRPRWIKTVYKKTRPHHTYQLVTKRCVYCPFRHHCLPEFKPVVVSGKTVYRRLVTDEEAAEIKQQRQAEKDKNRA